MPRPAAPGLYVHIPFCRRKCAYCDFASGVHPRAVRTAYLEALSEELSRRASRLAAPLETVYVGGGSPSSLDDGQWAALLDMLRVYASAGRVVEWTVEMNPSQVTSAKVRALEGSATRVSLGVQTFDPALRAMLGRTPRDPSCAKKAVDLLGGRFQLNVDLMHSLPGQTMAGLADDVGRALGLAPDHVSAYALTLEEHTPLHARVAEGRLSMPDEDFQADALAFVRRRLEAGGLLGYEISNFARPGHRCRHNLVYWHNEPCLGIGPAAAGLIDGRRYKNVADVAAYTAAVLAGRRPRQEEERLAPERRARETAMLELRLTEGIERRRFAMRYGRDPVELFGEPVQRHAERGLLAVSDTHVRLTRTGLLLADVVIADFL